MKFKLTQNNQFISFYNVKEKIERIYPIKNLFNIIIESKLDVSIHSEVQYIASFCIKDYFHNSDDYSLNSYYKKYEIELSFKDKARLDKLLGLNNEKQFRIL